MERNERRSDERLKEEKRRKLMKKKMMFMEKIGIDVEVIIVWNILKEKNILGNKEKEKFLLEKKGEVEMRKYKWFVDGKIWYNMGIKMIEEMMELEIGEVGGVMIGLWLERKKMIEEILENYVKEEK